MFGSTLLFLMECFRSHNYSMGMHHNDLCKMDTNMTSSDVNDNNVDHRHSHERRRTSDLGSVSDVGMNPMDRGGSIRMSSSGGNGMIDELAHLQCTCEHINGKVFGLANDDKVESDVSKQVDDVAVLEEEDVVLEDEELEKVVDDDDDDDDGEEGDHFVPRPIFEEEEEEDEFVKIPGQVEHFTFSLYIFISFA